MDIQVQGLSERMSFLKLLVLGTESTIGAQICEKISIRGMPRCEISVAGSCQRVKKIITRLILIQTF